MAKAFASSAYAQLGGTAIQVFGGIGFTWEHDIHLWFKRARLNDALFGDPVFHRERVARLSGY